MAADIVLSIIVIKKKEQTEERISIFSHNFFFSLVFLYFNLAIIVFQLGFFSAQLLFLAVLFQLRAVGA